MHEEGTLVGILSTIDRHIRAESIRQDGSWISDHVLSSGQDSDAGISVNERSGMRISAVWKCIRARAETFAMLPKKMFERIEILGRPGRKEAPQHPLYRIVHTNPNPTMTSMQFFELLSADLDSWGNNYNYIERGSTTGRVRYLWRIRPDYVRIDTTGGLLRYFITTDTGKEEPFLPDEILHIRGLGYDGIKGYSPIRMMMQTLGWNAAAQRYGAGFFKNASRPSGLVSLTDGVKPEKKPDIIEALKASGREAGKLVLIEGAVTYHKMTMDQDEAQFLETMQYQEEDICGIFRVPPHKVGNLRRSTNNNIEHQDIEWVRDSIQPICERTEQSFDMQLLSDAPSSGRGGGSERDRFYMECELKGLLRGDTAARTTFYREMFNTGSYSQNDILEAEHEEVFEGGDEHWIQLNMVPISMAKELLTQAKENPAEEKEPAESVQDRITRELQARVKVCYARLFRDAVGRILARKNGDRERSAQSAFRHILVSLAEGLSVKVEDEFIDRYLAAMGKRASTWNDSEADTVAAAELERAVNALLGGTHAQEKD
jgi:HK97 family phage portal protein